jgi:hypothetical protein
MKMLREYLKPGLRVKNLISGSIFKLIRLEGRDMTVWFNETTQVETAGVTGPNDPGWVDFELIELPPDSAPLPKNFMGCHCSPILPIVMGIEPHNPNCPDAKKGKK